MRPETLFPHVNLECKTSPKKFVAANGEQIRDLGEKNIPFKVHNVQKCECCQKLTFQCRKLSELETFVVQDAKNPHIRNIRDGTVIKLDVNNGVYTMDSGFASMKQVQFSAGRDSEWSSPFRQACKAGETEEKEKGVTK